MDFGLEESKQSVFVGLINHCYFTSSTPSIHLGGSFLVTPIAASGSKLIPDTRAIRSSANFKTENRSINKGSEKKMFKCIRIVLAMYKYTNKVALQSVPHQAPIKIGR